MQTQPLNLQKVVGLDSLRTALNMTWPCCCPTRMAQAARSEFPHDLNSIDQ